MKFKTGCVGSDMIFIFILHINLLILIYNFNKIWFQMDDAMCPMFVSHTKFFDRTTMDFYLFVDQSFLQNQTGGNEMKFR